MPCPVCGNDVWADAPHICPERFVAPARAVLTFYGYNSTNQCCREWMLLGWPEVDGRPKENPDALSSMRGMMQFECPKCHKALFFNLFDPDATIYWDQGKQGAPQPPALVAGRIR